MKYTAMKRTKRKAPDRVILFESGLIVALLLVNWMLNLSYMPIGLDFPDSPEIFEDSAFRYQEFEKQEQSQEQTSDNQKMEDEFRPEDRIETRADLKEFQPAPTIKNILKNRKPGLKPKLTKRPTAEPWIDSNPDEMAQFPGGIEALHEYVRRNLNPSVQMREYGADFELVLSFVVYSDGSVGDVRVVECNRKGLGAERAAISVLENMPDWIPAKNNGRNVNSYYKLPIEIQF